MDGLYFRVSSDRQTTENQFADLLQVAEKDDSERDWTSIRKLLSYCIVEEEVRGRGVQRTVYRVNPSVADRLADLCVYVDLAVLFDKASPVAKAPGPARSSSA